jgi:hypothetical protein
MTPDEQVLNNTPRHEGRLAADPSLLVRCAETK